MDGTYTPHFNFGLAWEWPYDDVFVAKLVARTLDSGLTCLTITPSDVEQVALQVAQGLTVDAYLDRASDADKRFIPIQQAFEARKARIFNRDPQAIWASDKATMHLEFITKGLQVPFTVILAPYEVDPLARHLSLAQIGSPFVIKPASFGGGRGVQIGTTLEAIHSARKQYPRQKYLAQELVRPVILENRRAWFRPIYVCGDIHLHWWDDRTHIYQICHPDDEQRFGLQPVRDIMLAIAEVSRLDFFSAEVCLTEKLQFVVVDYVNVPCDMRVQSIHTEGVPDLTVDRVVDKLVAEVRAIVAGAGR